MAEKEKEKKQKKEKEEKKEKKEKKEKDDKPKRRKQADVEIGFWAGATDDKKAEYGFETGPKAPRDKREQNKPAQSTAIKTTAGNEDGGRSAVGDLLAKKKTESQAKAKAHAASKAQSSLIPDSDSDSDQENYQVTDKIGNLLDRKAVIDCMSSCCTASTDSGPCQVTSKAPKGAPVILDRPDKFKSMGDFKTTRGFVFVRLPPGASKVFLKFDRPADVYLITCDGAASLKSAWRTCDDLCAPTVLGLFNVGDMVKKRSLTTKDDEKLTIRFDQPDQSLIFFRPNFFAVPFKDEIEGEPAEGDQVIHTATFVQQQGQTLDEKLETLKEKVARGEKLNAKDKKFYDRKIAEATFINPDDRDAIGDLKAFNLVLPGGSKDPPPSGDALVCEEFSLSAPGQVLFHNTQLKIVMNRRYGLLGPNGQGKTTLIRHIASREFPVPLDWDVLLVEQEAKASDNCVVDEVLAADTATATLRQEESQLMDSLEGDEAETWDTDTWSKKRERLVELANELEARGADSAEGRVRKILAGLGFTEDTMENTVRTFSGGWRMRISLAKALFLQPKLLLLDEPTNHLDLDAVLWLDNYLSASYPYAVLCISHDADFLDNVCTDVIHLEDKKLNYYRGGYTGFKSMHEQKKVVQAREFKDQQQSLKDFKKQGKTRDQAEELVKRKWNINSIDGLAEKKKDYIVNFKFYGLGQDQSIGGITMTDVAFSYDYDANDGKPWLLREVDMGVDCATRMAIVGPNGVGKSTVLNLMIKHLEPCEGEVAIQKGIRVRQYHQHFEELLPLDKDPVSYLMDSFYDSGVSTHEKARANLGQFGLPGSAHLTKIGNLSGGQKARVAFTALSLMKPHIIILDEPTNHLDVESVEALMAAINAYDGGIILVTHDARLIQAVNCDLWVVNQLTYKEGVSSSCWRFEKGFEGYRDLVLERLHEREEAAERKTAERAKLREEKRKQLGVSQLRRTPKKPTVGDGSNE